MLRKPSGDIERPSGFDYLRLALSIVVIASHTALSSYGVEGARMLSHSPLTGVPIRLVLPMFFALSGFLVAGSLFRCRTLVSFAGLRAIRIIPALSCEVLISALLLGPFYTTLPLHAYVADPAFHRYFLNIVGDIHYTLPGVFETNPYPGVVNVQLWTIPWELDCYVALAGLAMLGLAGRRVPMLAVMALLQLVLAGYVAFRLSRDVEPPAGASGPVLIAAFLAGLCVFLNRDRLPWTPASFGLAALLAIGLEAMPYGNYFVALPAAYATCFLGRCDPPRVFPITTGDYSYGIYLFGLPIQQAVAAGGPAFRHWWVSLLLGLPLAFLCAVLSWHLVEKPALRSRRHLGRLEDRWLRLRARLGFAGQVPRSLSVPGPPTG